MTSDGHGGDQPLSRAASGQLPPTTPVSPTASEIEPAAEVPGSKTPPRRTRLQAMQERIDLLEKELSESEHTHKLRWATINQQAWLLSLQFPVTYSLKACVRQLNGEYAKKASFAKSAIVSDQCCRD